MIVDQSKEERDAKAAKVYLGNVKVIWTNGSNVEAAPREDVNGQQAPAFVAEAGDDDLPF